MAFNKLGLLSGFSGFLQGVGQAKAERDAKAVRDAEIAKKDEQTRVQNEREDRRLDLQEQSINDRLLLSQKKAQASQLKADVDHKALAVGGAIKAYTTQLANIKSQMKTIDDQFDGDDFLNPGGLSEEKGEGSKSRADVEKEELLSQRAQLAASMERIRTTQSTMQRIGHKYFNDPRVPRDANILQWMGLQDQISIRDTGKTIFTPSGSGTTKKGYEIRKPNSLASQAIKDEKAKEGKKQKEKNDLLAEKEALSAESEDQLRSKEGATQNKIDELNKKITEVSSKPLTSENRKELTKLEKEKAKEVKESKKLQDAISDKHSILDPIASVAGKGFDALVNSLPKDKRTELEKLVKSEKDYRAAKQKPHLLSFNQPEQDRKRRSFLAKKFEELGLSDEQVKEFERVADGGKPRPPEVKSKGFNVDKFEGFVDKSEKKPVKSKGSVDLTTFGLAQKFLGKNLQKEERPKESGKRLEVSMSEPEKVVNQFVEAPRPSSKPEKADMTDSGSRGRFGKGLLDSSFEEKHAEIEKLVIAGGSPEEIGDMSRDQLSRTISSVRSGATSIAMAKSEIKASVQLLKRAMIMRAEKSFREMPNADLRSVKRQLEKVEVDIQQYLSEYEQTKMREAARVHEARAKKDKK